MSASTERIKELVIKYLNEELSASEMEELTEWMDQSISHREMIEEFMDEKTIREGIRNFYGTKEKIWKRVEEKLPDEKVVPLHRRHIWRWTAIAAAVTFIAFGLWVITERVPVSKQSGVNHEEAAQDVEAPTATKAILTLANGEKIVLDNASNGTLAIQSSVILKKTSDDRIVYESANEQPETELQYNTLANPRGSRIVSVVLSDGTRVWLNSESSITYPVVFKGSVRKVKITGEADFEVKHDATRPFKVSANAIEIEDLGTQFNVNAYNDETEIRTTLIEGSVRVMASANGKDPGVIIRPGEQAIVSLSADRGIRIQPHADLERVLAWKNDRFVFSNDDIQSVMRQLSRWYDVEVSYQGTVPTDEYVGVISRSRYDNISAILKIIETTKTVRFKIEGKKVIVMPWRE